MGVQCGLEGKCPGEGTRVPFRELTCVGCGVSFGTRSGIDGCSGDIGGIGVSSLGTLSSPLSKGEIIGSTGITLWGLSAKSASSSDHPVASLSLFSCSRFSSSCSLSHCQTICCRMNSTYSNETCFASGYVL